MNTVVVWYGHPVRTKQYTKNMNAKHAVKADISFFDIVENDIVQWLGAMVGTFRQLAAKWRRIAFVYDVIGNMVITTSVDARGNLSHRKIWLLQRL